LASGQLQATDIEFTKYQVKDYLFK